MISISSLRLATLGSTTERQQSPRIIRGSEIRLELHERDRRVTTLSKNSTCHKLCKICWELRFWAIYRVVTSTCYVIFEEKEASRLNYLRDVSNAIWVEKLATVKERYGDEIANLAAFEMQKASSIIMSPKMQIFRFPTITSHEMSVTLTTSYKRTNLFEMCGMHKRQMKY